jgi:hypothetical protein
MCTVADMTDNPPETLQERHQRPTWATDDDCLAWAAEVLTRKRRASRAAMTPSQKRAELKRNSNAGKAGMRSRLAKMTPEQRKALAQKMLEGKRRKREARKSDNPS